MTDPGRLKFGIEPSTRSKRLTIEGPSAVLLPTLATHFPGGQKVNGARIFELQDVAGDRLRWKLNAKAVGRLGDMSCRAACDRTNRFINGLVMQTHSEQLSPDPLFNLQAYVPSWGNFEFNFGAELQKPAVPSKEVEALVRDIVVGIAHALTLYRPYIIREEYEQRIATEIDLEGHGVFISLGEHSSIHTMGEDWESTATRFKVWDNNVSNGAEPLVYLAGAIAIAHADELVKQ